MKKGVFFAVLMGAALGLAGQSSPDAFEWAMALSNQRSSIAITTNKPVKMQNGDIFNFTLKSKAGCFVYVICQGADKAITVLWQAPLSAGEDLSLGPMELGPPPGTETFFFILSAAPQRKLEAAIAAFEGNPGSSQAKQGLVNEALNLRREIASLKEKPEQPAALDGAFRSPVKLEGLGFSGAHTYVKTIAVEH
jgi:hypothetical protein